MTSPASQLRALPPEKRKRVLSKLGDEAARALLGHWRFWARPNQLAPGTTGAVDPRTDWAFWLVMAGRGFGKTRSGAEWAIEQARAMPGSHGALVAPTTDDAKKVMLSAGLEAVEGASGILAVSPRDFMPRYEPSKRILTWPNSTVATLYTAEEPDRLRGPQHQWGWVDEMAAWAKNQEAWDQFLFGLRLGKTPRACITTTPRPIKILRQLLKDPRTVVSSGSTHENRENLAADWFASIINRYENTRLGRQELYAELLEDVPGALWGLGEIEAHRLSTGSPLIPSMRRVVVAIDPAVSNKAGSAETGIVSCGIGMCSCRGEPELHGFVLRDSSGKYSPNAWAQEAVALYRRMSADRVVAEVNNGGDLVEVNLRTVGGHVPYRAVHASRGKYTRAEPVAALYEQGKIHHVGPLPLLEDQMTTWDATDGSPSPDRVDALVWAFTDLLLDGHATGPLAYKGGARGRMERNDRNWGDM